MLIVVKIPGGVTAEGQDSVIIDVPEGTERSLVGLQRYAEENPPVTFDPSDLGTGVSGALRDTRFYFQTALKNITFGLFDVRPPEQRGEGGLFWGQEFPVLSDPIGEDARDWISRATAVDPRVIKESDDERLNADNLIGVSELAESSIQRLLEGKSEKLVEDEKEAILAALKLTEEEELQAKDTAGIISQILSGEFGTTDALLGSSVFALVDQTVNADGSVTTKTLNPLADRLFDALNLVAQGNVDQTLLQMEIDAEAGYRQTPDDLLKIAQLQFARDNPSDTLEQIYARNNPYKLTSEQWLDMKATEATGIKDGLTIGGAKELATIEAGGAPLSQRNQLIKSAIESNASLFRQLTDIIGDPTTAGFLIASGGLNAIQDLFNKFDPYGHIPMGGVPPPPGITGGIAPPEDGPLSGVPIEGEDGVGVGEAVSPTGAPVAPVTSLQSYENRMDLGPTTTYFDPATVGLGGASRGEVSPYPPHEVTGLPLIPADPNWGGGGGAPTYSGLAPNYRGEAGYPTPPLGYPQQIGFGEGLGYPTDRLIESVTNPRYTRTGVVGLNAFPPPPPFMVDLSGTPVSSASTLPAFPSSYRAHLAAMEEQRRLLGRANQAGGISTVFAP